MKRTTAIPVETIGTRIDYLIPNASKKSLPRWPADVFCICASLLQASGAYSRVVDDYPPHKGRQKKVQRAEELKRLGKSWRRSSTTKRKLPSQLENWWSLLIQQKNLPLNEIPNHRPCVLGLLNLLAAADESCVGLGLFFQETRNSDAFEDEAQRHLFLTAQMKTGATLCKEISPSKGRVLPKMHTPQNGLTVRSLSHHLAYSYSPDVCPEWLSAAQDNEHHSFNLLAIPWPFSIEPTQFRPTRTQGVSDRLDQHAYGMFTFDSSRGPSIEFVRTLIDEAKATVGTVDGIIFPELAMSHSEFEHLSKEFVNENCFLISGVGRSAPSSDQCGANEALLEVGIELREDMLMRTTFTQKKHHRWKLDKSQILQYGLASNLHPGAQWWEHIEVGGRTISFVTFRPWLTMSVLICEDLARPDPVGDVLRAVGPNLIIALLCDAPQLMSRWPGRYVGALADDPGSSVLTLTSLGAATLSKPMTGSLNKNRNVALWRDAKNGATELELPEAASALLLNLAVEYHEEWTADGRGDNRNAGYPVLSGVHPIFLKEGKEP
ncbi:hypothetical protein [Edaphobacter bradus]|uniref:hypothetical protein n=1 Tax=Edaphobacter bradus TaxID=2259016 RepID=UPI0021DFA935|nr:hypothetical protein [Edaphobacter bradus]